MSARLHRLIARRGSCVAFGEGSTSGIIPGSGLDIIAYNGLTTKVSLGGGAAYTPAMFYPVQGSDSNVLSSGTVAAGSTNILCPDSNLGATTSSPNAAVANLLFNATSSPLTSTPPSGTQLLGMASGSIGGVSNPVASSTVGFAAYYNSSAASITGTSALTFGTVAQDLTLTQLVNGDTVLYGSRATDSSATGNFINFLNAAKSTSMFKVDIPGREDSIFEDRIPPDADSRLDLQSGGP
jgi:hypothetical protein